MAQFSAYRMAVQTASEFLRFGGGIAVGLVLLAGLSGCGESPSVPVANPPVTGAAPGDLDEQVQLLTRENLDLKMRLVDAGAKTLPTVKVVRCAKPPVIDGQAGDAAWNDAEEVRFETNPWAEGPARQEPATRVKLLYDNDFLYVLFRVEGEQWVAQEKNRDGKVYEDERVEVFLDVDERDDFYDCVEINAIGTVDDYQCEFYRGYHHEWSPETLTAAAGTWTESGKTIGYVIETKIPWSAVTSKQNVGGKVIKEKEVPFQPKAGAVLGAGFYRIHRIPDGPNIKETYSLWREPWSPFPDYHLTSTFGRMVLE